MQHATDVGLYSNLITSAVLLTKDKLRALADAGLCHIQISFQGNEPMVADRVAGMKDAHAKKMEVAHWARELDLPVVMVDGICFSDRVILVALGIDAKGNKHVLGLREGSTEKAQVVKSLLSDLVERGLDAEQARLWVIDGGKALRSAIVRMFAVTGFSSLPIRSSANANSFRSAPFFSACRTTCRTAIHDWEVVAW